MSNRTTRDEAPHPSFFRVPSPSEFRGMRNMCGLNQQEVADELGLDVRTVRNWETGDSYPEVRNLDRLLGLYRLHWPQFRPQDTGDSDV